MKHRQVQSDKIDQLLLGFRRKLGRVILNRNQLEDNEDLRLWWFLIGNKWRAVADAEASREETLLFAGSVSFREW